MENDKKPMEFYRTPCCAILFSSLQNYHTYKEIKSQIEYFKRESNSENWYGKPNSLGQRSIIVIVSPREDDLEHNLQKLGFQLLSQNIPRRKGYPKGLLKMYMLSW